MTQTVNINNPVVIIVHPKEADWLDKIEDEMRRDRPRVSPKPN